jgi:hypothetical protein
VQVLLIDQHSTAGALFLLPTEAVVIELLPEKSSKAQTTARLLGKQYLPVLSDSTSLGYGLCNAVCLLLLLLLLLLVFAMREIDLAWMACLLYN